MVSITSSRPLSASESAPSTSDRAIAVWLLACCAMIFAMVVIGGITRLTESGLSITEWKPISGVIPPLSEAQWAQEFERYKAIPQYQAIHADMTLADFKTIFFWEWLHRLWGRLIGVVFAAPFLWFLWKRRLPRSLAPKLAIIFVLGGLQGALGWFMVESGLSERIEVSQYRLVAHLAAALILYLAILWVALSLLRPRPSGPAEPRGSRLRAALEAVFELGLQAILWTYFIGGLQRGEPFKLWSSLLFVGAIICAWVFIARRTRSQPIARLRRGVSYLLAFAFITVLAGGFVAGLRAGYLYNTFPLMNGEVLPPDYAALTPWYLNPFENPSAAQFDHRALAELTWFFALALWLASWRYDLSPGARRTIHALALIATIQLGLGIATLLLVVPIPLAAAHQAGAVALLTAILIVRHHLRRPEGRKLDAGPAPAL